MFLRHLKALSHNLIVYEGTAKFKCGKFKPPTGPRSVEVVSLLSLWKSISPSSLYFQTLCEPPDPQHQGKARP